MATSSDINSLFQSTLGRSADKSGLDYYTKMANEKGIDWVKNSLAGSDEAKSYQSTNKAATVQASDRVSGLSYSSPSSSSSKTSSSNTSAVSDSAINDLYQQYLGRSVDQGGLDYWRQEASSKGLDYMRNQLAGSDEANIYQQRGSAFTVSALDQVDGFNYRSASDVAYNQAQNAADYGLLSNAMQKGVEQGRFTPVQGANGETLYRSANGGLYTVTGAPAEQTQSVPQSTVSPNQTSQYQLEQILASDSPLMQRAATQGQQMANQRGLLNSSMAGEAAQGAMIDRATPLAQQDAQTYFQNSQANTDRQMQSYMSEQQFGQTLQQMEQQFGYNSQLSSQEAQQSLSNLYATSTANAWGVFANNATDLIGQASSAINQIQMNPDITSENKSAMIQQILEMRDTDLQFQQDLYGNLSNYLKDTGLFPNLA